MTGTEETTNFELFRDILSAPLIEKLATTPPKSKRKRKGNGYGSQKSAALMPTTINEVDNDSSSDAEELLEFINYIATEVFTSLPSDLRTLTHTTYVTTSTLQALYALPLTPSTASRCLHNLDPAVIETLMTYAGPASDPGPLLIPVLSDYLTHITTAPPPPSTTKSLAQGCEICEREYVPLTYHHLIPRMVHEKAVKRGWHKKEDLNRVAWLCRACHSFVHRLAGHEELARELFTVARLLEREEVQRWRRWAAGVRWKKR